MVGIINSTNVTFDSIQQMANSSTMSEFLVRSNETIFSGWFWFIMLWVTFVIFFVAANKVKDQPLNNLMYSSTIISFGALLLRVIHFTIDGTDYSLLSDTMFWIFPLITVLMIGLVWMTKRV